MALSTHRTQTLTDEYGVTLTMLPADDGVVLKTKRGQEFLLSDTDDIDALVAALTEARGRMGEQTALVTAADTRAEAPTVMRGPGGRVTAGGES